MDKIRIMRQSKMDALIKDRAVEAVKGYYGENDDNLLFRILDSQLKNAQLPPSIPISREGIKESYETCAPLHGIVRMIAEATGEVAKSLELIDIKTGKAVERHDVLDILRKPNDRYNLAKYVEGWATNKLLFDDAWQYTEKSVGKVRKTQLYLIPSQVVKVIRKGAADPMTGIQLTIGDTSKTIPTKDLILSFGYNLDPASYFGTSKVVAAAKYLSVMDRGMRRQDTALNNGGAANIITPKASELGIKPSDAEEIEKRFNNVKNAGKTLTARTAIEVHSLGNTPVDLNILSSHKEAVTALCFAYSIPVDLYYGQAKYENAKEAKKSLYEQNAIPLAEEFANDVLKHFGLDDALVFKVNTDKIDILQDNPYDIIVKMNQAGAFTTNEIRETAGWERIEKSEMDEVRLPMGINVGEDYDVSEL